MILLLTCVALGAQAQDRPLYNIVVSNVNVPAPGYAFIAPISPDSLSIVDNLGRHIFKAESMANVVVAVQPDGSMVHFNGIQRAFIRRNARMEILDTLKASAGYDTDFHEFLMMDGGKYLVIGLKNVQVDMSTKVPGGKADAQVANNVIQIRTLGGQTVFEWQSIDHIPVTDATQDIDLTQASINPVHINSVVFDTDSNLIVSCRNLDAVYKINYKTGEIIWKLGGSKAKGNQFRFLNDTVNSFVGFSHQHHVHRLANGNLVMFDNGNLKPTQASRVVEYELDESAKTIKKVWEYAGTEQTYAPTMGSVQELSSGRLVIGWGSSTKPIIGEEIDKGGIVYCLWSSPAEADINVYRFSKSTFFMTGFEKNISSVGTTNFSNADSNTFVSIVASSITGTVRAVVERHSYLPHNFSIPAGVPCTVYPMRWMIRYTNQSNIQGSIKFSLAGATKITNPALCTLYRNSKEGAGGFTAVAATYDAASKTFTAPLASGEYVIVSSVCLDPVILSPKVDSITLVDQMTFRWTRAIENSGYQFQLSTRSDFSSFVVDKSVTDTTITQGIERGLVYYWRVAARRTADPTVWVQSTFQSTLRGVTLLNPILAADTVSFGGDQTFNWTISKNATQYRLRVTNPKTNNTVLDSLVADTLAYVTKRLPGNAMLLWSVQAIRGEIFSSWSGVDSLYTGAIPPTLLKPLNNEIEVNSSYPEMSWGGIAGVSKFRLRVVSTYASSSKVEFDGIVEGTSKTLTTIANSSAIEWKVLSMGEYGEGQWSPTWMFRSTSFNAFPKAVTITPKVASGIENVRFLWNKVKGAEYYTLQLTTHPDFGKPELTFTNVADTSFVVKRILPETTYRWRVVGLSDIGNGSWSDAAVFFTTADSIPLYPVYPVRDTTISTTSVDARFTLGVKYKSYNIVLSTDSTFATKILIPGSGTPLHINGLLPETKYWWYVQGVISDSSLDSGIHSSFKVGVISGVDDQDEAQRSIEVRVDNGWLKIQTTFSLKSVHVYDIKGNTVVQCFSPSTILSGIPFAETGNGIYFIVITDSVGNQHKRQILSFK